MSLYQANRLKFHSQGQERNGDQGVHPHPERALISTELLRSRLLVRHFDVERLSLHLEQQIMGILRQQFSLDPMYELGGGVYLERTEESQSIDLKLHEGSEAWQYPVLLDLFRDSDDPCAAEFLRPVIVGYFSQYGEHFQAITDFIDLMFKLAEEGSTEIQGEEYQEGKQLAMPYLEDAIASIYSPFHQELIRARKGMLGFFHVHYNGSPPSSVDLHVHEESKIPGLVISATQDFETTGFRVYFLVAGTSRQLFPRLQRED